MKKSIGILWLVLVMAGSALAQQPSVVTSDKAGWHKLGETTVSLESERDEILVFGKDKFKALRIQVLQQPVYITSMTVYFENGETEDIDVKEDMKAGSKSKVFNLKHGGHELKKISFVYKTPANAGKDKAHIEVYGLK